MLRDLLRNFQLLESSLSNSLSVQGPGVSSLPFPATTELPRGQGKPNRRDIQGGGGDSSPSRAQKDHLVSYLGLSSYGKERERVEQG